MKPLIAVVVILTALIAGLYFYNSSKAVTVIPVWPTEIVSIPDLNKYFKIDYLKMTEKDKVKTWNIKVEKANSVIIQKYIKSLESSGFIFDTSKNISEVLIQETYKKDLYSIAITYNAIIDEGNLTATIVVQP